MEAETNVTVLAKRLRAERATINLQPRSIYSPDYGVSRKSSVTCRRLVTLSSGDSLGGAVQHLVELLYIRSFTGRCRGFLAQKQRSRSPVGGRNQTRLMGSTRRTAQSEMIRSNYILQPTGTLGSPDPTVEIETTEAGGDYRHFPNNPNGDLLLHGML